MSGGYVMLGVPRNGVSLVNHNENWANEFKKAKKILENIHKDNIIDIQHVGSTAINGIMAKPLLDIAIMFKDISIINLKGMQENGYDYCGDTGVAGKYFFVLRGEDEVSLQHIHCYAEDSEYFAAQINFRDYINSHPEYAREYESLKQELYKQYPDDRKKYTSGKVAFFNKIKLIANGNRYE